MKIIDAHPIAFWAGFFLWALLGVWINFARRWELWPVKPVMTHSLRPTRPGEVVKRPNSWLISTTADAMKSIQYDHFIGVTLGINGGYAGWNVTWWEPRCRCGDVACIAMVPLPWYWPRIRWAAMLWRK